MKKIYLAILVVTLAITSLSFLSMGCATKELYQGRLGENEDISYRDSIVSFASTQDGKQIVFMSDKYHYIFDTNAPLSYLLSQKNDKSISFGVQSGNYRVENNHIDADFTVHIIDQNQSNPIVSRVMAEKWGKINKRTNEIDVRIHIYGTRYLADPKVNQKVVALNKPIKLYIREDKRVGVVQDAVERIALTPFALAADVVLVPLWIFLGMPTLSGHL